MSGLPTNPKPSFMALNPHIYGKQKTPIDVVQDVTWKPKKRIRQDSKPLMNKLEAEWLAQLEAKFPCSAIRCQAVRFRLGNGIWYKPDFFMSSAGSRAAYEVKGPHAFRGGFENLKVAASLYPEIIWILAWKENGEWKQQEVLP